MRRFPSLAIAAVCLVGLAVPAMAQQADQQEPQPSQPQQTQQQPKQVLKATYGDWEIHCIEGTDTCVMQQIGKTADGKRALLVTIERLSGVTAQGKPVAAAMTVNVPLGVLIPYGVRLKIDDGEVKPVPLMRCLPESCAAREPLDDAMVDTLKKGSAAKFGFYLQNEVLADVSLDGFTKAYSELKPIEASKKQ